MSHNDITGDKIKSKDNSDDFRKGWDKINWGGESDIEKVREKNFERYGETYKKMAED